MYFGKTSRFVFGQSHRVVFPFHRVARFEEIQTKRYFLFAGSVPQVKVDAAGTDVGSKIVFSYSTPAWVMELYT